MKFYANILANAYFTYELSRRIARSVIETMPCQIGGNVEDDAPLLQVHNGFSRRPGHFWIQKCVAAAPAINLVASVPFVGA